MKHYLRVRRPVWGDLRGKNEYRFYSYRVFLTFIYPTITQNVKSPKNKNKTKTKTKNKNCFL